MKVSIGWLGFNRVGLGLILGVVRAMTYAHINVYNILTNRIRALIRAVGTYPYLH